MKKSIVDEPWTIARNSNCQWLEARGQKQVASSQLPKDSAFAKASADKATTKDPFPTSL